MKEEGELELDNSPTTLAPSSFPSSKTNLYTFLKYSGSVKNFFLSRGTWLAIPRIESTLRLGKRSEGEEEKRGQL